VTPDAIKARMDARRAQNLKRLHVEEPKPKRETYEKHFASRIAKMANAEVRFTFKVLCKIADNHLEIVEEQAKLNGELSVRIVALEERLNGHSAGS
jgi:hypothetical protein